MLMPYRAWPHGSRVVTGMAKQDLETGTATYWGAFVGESRGYTVHEGTEVEIGSALQRYRPFVRFTVHPISTVSQMDELIEGLLQ
jgi:hypothetical protein